MAKEKQEEGEVVRGQTLGQETAVEENKTGLEVISGGVGRAFKATRRTSGLGGLEFSWPNSGHQP